MYKTLIVIVIAIVWFLFSGFYLAQRDDIETWFYTSILYLMGMSWVIPFVLSKTMTAPYAGPALTPESKFMWHRLFYFTMGMTFSLMASFYKQ